MGLSLLIRRPVGVLIILQLGTLDRAHIRLVIIGKVTTLLYLMAMGTASFSLLAMAVVATAGHPIWYMLLSFGRIIVRARWPLP